MKSVLCLEGISEIQVVRMTDNEAAINITDRLGTTVKIWVGVNEGNVLIPEITMPDPKLLITTHRFKDTKCM